MGCQLKVIGIITTRTGDLGVTFSMASQRRWHLFLWKFQAGRAHQWTVCVSGRLGSRLYSGSRWTYKPHQLVDPIVEGSRSVKNSVQRYRGIHPRKEFSAADRGQNSKARLLYYSVC